MEHYDVVIVGGSIAGSVAARFLAMNNLKTLLVESAKTPREKPCSAIQFNYLESIIGSKIPREKLCSNDLNRLYMEWPNGKSFNLPFKMLNFTRDVFDSWLNDIAVESGAIFRDATRCTDFKTTSNGFEVFLHPKHGTIEKVSTKYLIGADGLLSTIRKIVRPQDFYGKGEKSRGITLNYYLKALDEGDLDSNTLYQFWNLDFNNLMFAWTYKKNDLWVVGTGYTEDIRTHCDLLLEYVKEKFNFEGEIVKREGFASKFRLDEPDHVYLGEDNLMFTGDAAGLVDVYRGLGMDAAALSGRRAAKSILKAESKGNTASYYYKKSMKKLVKKIDKNMERQLLTFKNNDDLLEYLKRTYLKTGIMTFFGNLFNKFLSGNRKILLPL
ncbi:MAG: NAD(P)/FAD-dependent oxidoreductase [Promethearchaeota archaeon]|jgi:flavin-dependent dehydrogenase